jgi:hypothetical protein
VENGHGDVLFCSMCFVDGIFRFFNSMDDELLEQRINTECLKKLERSATDIKKMLQLVYGGGIVSKIYLY